MIVTTSLFRPFDQNPNALPYRRHPFFYLTKMRGVIAQHSEREEAALQKHAKGRKSLAEIGVAEGASALALRCAADSSAMIYLIDPYPNGRIPGLNLSKLCAKSHVRLSRNATVKFIQGWSHEVAADWKTPLDFLFIDGDHSYDACMQDWQDWSCHVRPNGVVAFHDARTFAGGWPRDDWGPVRVVDELFRHGQTREWTLIDEVDSLVFVKRN